MSIREAINTMIEYFSWICSFFSSTWYVTYYIQLEMTDNNCGQFYTVSNPHRKHMRAGYHKNKLSGQNPTRTYPDSKHHLIHLTYCEQYPLRYSLQEEKKIKNKEKRKN